MILCKTGFFKSSVCVMGCTYQPIIDNLLTQRNMINTKVVIQDIGDSGRPTGKQTVIEVGTKEDGSIKEISTIGDNLYVLKEFSLYELNVIDEKGEQDSKSRKIKRVTQKKVISQGAESIFVAKTFLTAKSVFQDGNFKNNKRNEIFQQCIKMLFEFSSLIEAVLSYNQFEEKVIKDFAESEKSSENFIIPSISDIRTRAKTIFQKIDQISQILRTIIKLYYPNNKKEKTPFEQLRNHFEKKHGKGNPYTQYLANNLEFFCNTRYIRNGLDHTETNFVIIEDFKYEEDHLLMPSIELTKKDCPLGKQNFKKLINEILQVYPLIIEHILIMMADDNIENNVFGFRVREIPEEKRMFKEVRYGLWSPVGKEGFFNMNF